MKPYTLDKIIGNVYVKCPAHHRLSVKRGGGGDAGVMMVTMVVEVRVVVLTRTGQRKFSSSKWLRGKLLQTQINKSGWRCWKSESSLLRHHVSPLGVHFWGPSRSPGNSQHSAKHSVEIYGKRLTKAWQENLLLTLDLEEV